MHPRWSVALSLVVVAWPTVAAANRTCTQVSGTLAEFAPCEVVTDEPGVLSVVRNPAVSVRAGWLAGVVTVPDVVSMLQRARAAYAPTGLNLPVVMVLSTSPMRVGFYTSTVADRKLPHADLELRQILRTP